MKSCKWNEHAQGSTVLMSSSRTAEGHLHATYTWLFSDLDSSDLTPWSSHTFVACIWLNFLLRPLKLATFVLPSVHSNSLGLEHGAGESLHAQYCLKVCHTAKPCGRKSLNSAGKSRLLVLSLYSCPGQFTSLYTTLQSFLILSSLYIQLMLPDPMCNSLYLAFSIWLFLSDCGSQWDDSDSLAKAVRAL